MSGRISFIGAGPGAADLITVRGARRIAEADVVVWTASLVAPECIKEHARNDAELVDSSQLSHEHAVEIFRRAERDKLKVARVHSGDPSLWGGVQDQHDACSRMDLDVEIVPGVAAFSAAAAAVGRELTVPEVAQSVVVTRLEGGDPPMPERERVREFAKHGTTMALFLSASRAPQLVEELSAGGYAEDVPVLVAYKVSWPDEIILRTTLGELEQTVKQHKLWRNTLFLVGKSVGGNSKRARTYAASQLPAYRRPTSAARRAVRTAQEARSRRSESLHGGEEDSSYSEPLGGSSSEVVPEQRTVPVSPRPEQGPRDSDVAWWAVRSWQDTARGMARTTASRTGQSRPAASRRTSGSDQPDLFLVEQDGAGAERKADVETTGEVGVDGDGDPGAKVIETSTATPIAESAAGAEVAGSPVAEAVAAQATRAASEQPIHDQAGEDQDGAAARPGRSTEDSGAVELPAQPSVAEQPATAGKQAESRPSKRTTSAARRTSAAQASAKTAPKARAKSKGKTAGSGKSPTAQQKPAGDNE